MLSKFFQLVKTHQADLALVVCIIILTVVSFNLGKISEKNNKKHPITIKNGQSTRPANILKSVSGGEGREDLAVVASKKSQSKLYHFTWCPGASQIAAQNKLTFPNETAATAAGFTLASNCSK